MTDHIQGGAAEYAANASAQLAMRVVREHEPRPMGCACGASMGDNIDYRNHLVNQDDRCDDFA